MAGFDIGSLDSMSNAGPPSYSTGFSGDFGPYQKIASALQGQVSQAINSSSAVTRPWSVSKVQSTFFPSIQIDASRWDQLFPYRFLVIDANNNNQIVNGGDPYDIKTIVTKGTSESLITFQPLGNQWVYQLPITPQQLTITDNFAINTTATLRGVLEEHGGLKFKTINAAGSFGVWPGRSSSDIPPAFSVDNSIVQSVFGGTIQAINNVVDQVQGVINTATTGHPANAPKTVRPEDLGNNGLGSTGYYQAMSLQQFFEQYAEAKKNPKNAGWRLVFDIRKQNTSYVVSPMQYNWQQNANKNMEIMYAMQLKAWRRIDLAENIFTVEPSIQPLNAGVLQRILNTISQARSATSAAINLISSVRSDLEAPLNVLRQTSLFVKDLAGVVITAADLPFQLQKDYASGIKQSINNLSSAISSTQTSPSLRAAVNSVAASTAGVEGLSLNAVAGGQLGTSAAQAQSIDPANNIFSNPEGNFTLFDQVPVYSLTLNPQQQQAVDQVIGNAQQTTVDDLKQYRAVIQQLALQLSNSFGTGDEYYNRVYGLPPPTVRIQPISLDEYDLLDVLYDSMQSYDLLTASNQINNLQAENNLEFVAGLAQLSDIPFNVATSKILAPVPFGLTIEGISARYLGDPQRWIEIATLNNLEEPYIDETGFVDPLLSNATGRQITISNVDNLFVGQKIGLYSATQSPTFRTILSIDSLSSTSFLLTLDGLPNLDNYLIADKAYLQAYLPNTVNSQQKIFIPSTLPVSTDPDITPPSSTSHDPLTGLSKVDLLLTDSGDLAVNNFGDFRFSAGITNIIQALKIKLATGKGTVLTHPDFGLGIKPGIINSETSAQDIYNSISKLIKQDPRFQGLSSLQVQIDGPTLTINMGVMLAGNNGVYPLYFQLNN